MNIILPVIVKGRGKIDETFNEPVSVPYVSDDGDWHFP
jgi:hypothetical protein